MQVLPLLCRLASQLYILLALEGLKSNLVVFSLPTLQSAFQILYLIVINSTRLYCMSSLTVQLSVIGYSNTSVGQLEQHTHAKSAGLELGCSSHPRLLYRIPEVGFPVKTIHHKPTQCKSVCTVKCLYELFPLQLSPRYPWD